MIASTLDDRAAFDARLAEGQPRLVLQPDDARARAQMARCRENSNQADCDEMVRAGLVNGRSCPEGTNVVLKLGPNGEKLRVCENTDTSLSARQAAILAAEAQARAGVGGPSWLVLGGLVALGAGAYWLLR